MGRPLHNRIFFKRKCFRNCFDNVCFIRGEKKIKKHRNNSIVAVRKSYSRFGNVLIEISGMNLTIFFIFYINNRYTVYIVPKEMYIWIRFQKTYGRQRNYSNENFERLGDVISITRGEYSYMFKPTAVTRGRQEEFFFIQYELNRIELQRSKLNGSKKKIARRDHEIDISVWSESGSSGELKFFSRISVV